jgi:tryptophan synthase beta subunit
VREAASLKGKTVLVNLSGRGDKDLGILESLEKNGTKE